jgi:hypothetical protein
MISNGKHMHYKVVALTEATIFVSPLSPSEFIRKKCDFFFKDTLLREEKVCVGYLSIKIFSNEKN